jgi:sterol desaturase/sphingolipid hydroxylase (fatty acid hydroxylase superfamily)
MAAVRNLWKGRTHDLGRMTLRELVPAYFSYPAIQTYIVLAALSFALAVHLATAVVPLVLATLLATLVYPLVWYLLHRFVLHGRFLYRWRWTAATWKRIHFDHHQDPRDLRVLFGALHTTLPTIAVVTISVGWAIGGPAAAAAALGTGLVTTCVYEFCHCVQHLNYTPRSPFLQRIKRLHLAHHFHNEHGNFGITNFLWDRVFATYHARAKDVARSPTVFNIGYTEGEAARFPWVRRLSNGIRRDVNPRVSSPRASEAEPAADPARRDVARSRGASGSPRSTTPSRSSA